MAYETEKIELPVNETPPPIMSQETPLCPFPKSLNFQGVHYSFPKHISVAGLSTGQGEQERTIETLQKLFNKIPDVSFDFNGVKPFKIKFQRSDSVPHPEGYLLVSSDQGIEVTSRTAAGEFYAAQTLYQFLIYADMGLDMLQTVFGEEFRKRRTLRNEARAQQGGRMEKRIPALTVHDEPAYRIRSAMLDLGRATFPMPLIKRMIRILAHLKMNTLHLHLWDNELCGFRFKNLPMGRDNPHALDAAGLSEVIRYARSYHMSVIPELESWGHVQSIITHYPDLDGIANIMGGNCFAVGEKTFSLLAKIYDEIVPLLEDTSGLHVGLDEASWKVMPGEEDRGYTPENLVGRIYSLVQEAGQRHGKKLTMHLWGDQGGRPLPKEIENKVVIQPWNYWRGLEKMSDEALAKYGGKNKGPFLMGAGTCVMHFKGSFGATRYWCEQGVKYPNCLGATICLWGSNDLGSRLISVYSGADCAWSPGVPAPGKDDPFEDEMVNNTTYFMRIWQTVFDDANPDGIRADQGLEVFHGQYAWPPNLGKRVPGSTV